MNILSRIDYENIKGRKDVKYFFFIWLFFCILTAFAFYYQIRILDHVDVPTHLGAGLVIAAFIFSAVKVKNGREALALAFIPFLLWEMIEIGVSSWTHDPFIYRLFHETVQNKVQDIVMDILGFMMFIKMTVRRF